ncbi:DUF86 domain-containing protein [bacterium]|nr:DUF86 domain-containing protein [bacterium]
MRKTPIIYIEDILECIEFILEDLKTTSLEELELNRHLRDSIIYRFMILGEAASKISRDIREQFPKIAWREIIAMRNILIHEYSGVDISIVFDTAKQKLPSSKKLFEKALKELKEQ